FIYFILLEANLIENYETITIWTLIALFFYYALSQTSLPISSYLIITNNPRPILYSNLTYSFLAMASLFCIMQFLKISNFEFFMITGASIIYFVLAILQAIKFLMLKKLSHTIKV
ncbi:hypothetical protein, partial [Vibrio splendidus]|uniref:hypothetical protein n=1 Tax=Vibrio splendidus TaxID=29497 RepID=UPI001A7E050E